MNTPFVSPFGGRRLTNNNQPISVKSFGYSYIPGASLGSVQQSPPLNTFGTAQSPSQPGLLFAPAGPPTVSAPPINIAPTFGNGVPTEVTGGSQSNIVAGFGGPLKAIGVGYVPPNNAPTVPVQQGGPIRSVFTGLFG